MEKITDIESINQDNWSHTARTNGTHQVIISMGGQFDEKAQDLVYLYFLTVLSSENKELYQEEYSDLAQAIKAINHKYGHWDCHIRGNAGSSSGGCGDCAAH